VDGPYSHVAIFEELACGRDARFRSSWLKAATVWERNDPLNTTSACCTVGMMTTSNEHRFEGRRSS